MLFLGSSPERLWRRRDKALRTEALAGTVANHPDDKQAQQLGGWLMADDKNQRENMLVVEDICQRLPPIPRRWMFYRRRYCVCVKCSIFRRCIWTSLNKADDVICLHQLQPTAAVAGLPRDLARRVYRPSRTVHPRMVRWFCGLSLITTKRILRFPAAQQKSAAMSCGLYAGAGIVRGSDPEQEWQEIDNKAAGILYKWNSNESHHYRFHINNLFRCPYT